MSPGRFWGWLLKAKQHIGKALWVPILLNAAMIIGQVVVTLDEEGFLDEQKLHHMLKTGSGVTIIVLVVIMALLKIKH